MMGIINAEGPSSTYNMHTYPEKCDKNMGFGITEKYESQECRNSTIQNGCANGGDALLGLFLFVTFINEEANFF